MNTYTDKQNLYPNNGNTLPWIKANAEIEIDKMLDERRYIQIVDEKWTKVSSRSD